MSLLPNYTNANLATPYYALAGESTNAANWYKYPSETGQVLMVDASGTQVLQSIDGDLFFNQELLAKAGDIQDIADWSLYPVLNNNGVDFNQKPILNASTIDASGALTVGGDITGGGALSVTGAISGSELTVTGAIQGTSLSVSALAKAIAPGGIQGDSLSISGAAAVGSVTSTGAISATSLTTTGAVVAGSMQTSGGIDMQNTSVNRASAIGLNNSGFAPYGQLTSPNGTQLLWNGSTISTGGAGDVSQWANFQAVAPIMGNGQPISNVSTINTTGNITSSAGYVQAPNLISDVLIQLYDPVGNKPLKISGQNPAGVLFNSLAGGIAMTAAAGKIESTATDDINLVTSGGDVNVTAYDQIIMNSGNDILLTADPGINPLYTAAINLTAKNGNGGQINIVADPGEVAAFGGVVNITGNGGTILIPQEPPAPPISVTVGGEVNITANTGGSGLYTLTSAVNIQASCINSYAGAVSPLASVAGYNFIYGTAGVNICSGLPSAGFQLPFSTYLYGVGVPGAYGGIRLQSPNGIQMLSDTYMTNLYPLDTDGLNIAGRSYLGTGSVYIQDVATFEMNGGAALKTDNISSVSNSGILYTDNFFPLNNTKGIYANFVKPIQATAPGVPNLVISGNPFLGNNNYVEVQNADVIAFDATGAGSLTGVKSINGAAWPPPTGDASLWSQYPATSVIDASGHGIINLTTINGSVYPPVVSSADWSQYPALQNVDISGFDLNNVNNLTMPANGIIVAAGQLNIFADLSGSLNLATNGGGNVNIGTGNAGDINITTSGTGNDLDLGGDAVNISATQGVRVAAPVLDMTGNDIYNVGTLRGSLATDMRVLTTGAGLLSLQSDIGGTNITTGGPVNITANANITTDSANGSVITTAFANADITATNGTVNITAGQQVDINAANINLNANVVANGGFIGTSAVINGLLTANSINSLADVVSKSGTSNPYSLNTIGGLVDGNQQYDYWVAVNGSNTTGTGSVLRPFATITAALAATVSISDSIPININIAAGTYTENPTVTRNNTFLVGNVGVADAVIIGTVTFDPAATATVSQGMSGITVVGNAVFNDAISFDINWYVQFCNITSYTAAAINAFSTGSGNNSLVINNTVVTQNVTANTAITLNSVRLNAIQVQINNTTTGACISCNGTASMSVFGCTLTSAGAATASALITYINAVSNGSPSSFNLNTFTYTAGTAGSAKAAFFFNNAGGLAGSTVINNNVFALPGAAALIQRPGAGSIAIAWGANTTSIQTIPAAGAGLTYTYTASTPLSATALYDQLGSAGTNQQVLGAGGGGQLQWRSLTNTSLGAIPQAAAASVYQNQPLYFNTTTNAINYIAVADDVIVQPCPATLSPIPSNKGTTYILTSTGASTFTFNNNAGTPLTANDAGWYLYIKNGNGTGGGDITINGTLVSGNTVVHNQTATQNGQIVIVRWTGTAFVVY